MKKLRIVIEQKFPQKKNSQSPLKPPQNTYYWSNISRSILSSAYEKSDSTLHLNVTKNSQKIKNEDKLVAENVCENLEDLANLKNGVVSSILKGQPLSSKKLKLAQQFLKMYPSLKFFYKENSVQPILRRIESSFEIEKLAKFNDFSSKSSKEIGFLKEPSKQNFSKFKQKKLETYSIIPSTPQHRGTEPNKGFGSAFRKLDRHKSQYFSKAKIKFEPENNNFDHDFTLLKPNNPLFTLPINQRIAYEVNRSTETKHYNLKMRRGLDCRLHKRSISVGERGTFEFAPSHKIIELKPEYTGSPIMKNSPNKLNVALRRLSGLNQPITQSTKTFQKTANKLLPWIALRKSSKDKKTSKIFEKSNYSILMEAEKEGTVSVRRNSCRCRDCGNDNSNGKLEFIRKLDIIENDKNRRISQFSRVQEERQKQKEKEKFQDFELDQSFAIKTSLERINSKDKIKCESNNKLNIEKRNSDFHIRKSVTTMHLLDLYLPNNKCQETIEENENKKVKSSESKIRKSKTKGTTNTSKKGFSNSKSMAENLEFDLNSHFNDESSKITNYKSQRRQMSLGISAIMEYNKKAKFVFKSRANSTHANSKSMSLSSSHKTSSNALLNENPKLKKRKSNQTVFAFSRIYGRENY